MVALKTDSVSQNESHTIFETNIFHSSVATCLTCGKMHNDDFHRKCTSQTYNYNPLTASFQGQPG